LQMKNAHRTDFSFDDELKKNEHGLGDVADILKCKRG